MPTYTHEIISLYTAPLKDSLQNVVVEVNWRYQVTDGSDYADLYLRTKLNSPSPDTFVLYDQLTDDQVFAWVQSCADMDEIKAEVDKRLEKTKTPDMVEKKVPWDKTSLYSGTEEYFLVKDGQIDDAAYTFGPFLWRNNEVLKGLEKLSISHDFPTDIEMYQKGLLPIDTPLAVGDNAYLYLVKERVRPEIDRFYQSTGDITWSIQDGKVVGEYSVVDTPVDDLKQQMINRVEDETLLSQEAGVNATVNGNTVKVSTSLENRVLLFQNAFLMEDSDQEDLKLNGSDWASLTKDQSIELLKNISDQMKALTAQQKLKVEQIQACQTIEDLKQLEI